jgi:transposase
LVTDRSGQPLVAEVTAGQCHESPQAIPLLERSLERVWPQAVAGDKGYSARTLRSWLEEREIEPVIPYRQDELGDHAYDREAYRDRSMIERTFNRLKRHRRIATRFEKLASSYLALVTIAMMLEWI